MPLPHLKKSETYMKLDCKHLKFVKFWIGCKNNISVANQIIASLEAEDKRKVVQFLTLFQILSHGHSMCDYKRLQHLLRHLKVKHVSKQN